MAPSSRPEKSTQCPNSLRWHHMLIVRGSRIVKWTPRTMSPTGSNSLAGADKIVRYHAIIGTWSHDVVLHRG
jgi:hypothetical protein